MLPHQPCSEQQLPNSEPWHVVSPPQVPSGLTFKVCVGAGAVVVVVVRGLSGMPAPGPVGSLVGDVTGGSGESAGSVLSGEMQVPNCRWHPPPQ